MAKHTAKPATPADDDLLGELAADHVSRITPRGQRPDTGQSAHRQIETPAERNADAAPPEQPQAEESSVSEKAKATPAVATEESLEAAPPSVDTPKQESAAAASDDDADYVCEPPAETQAPDRPHEAEPAKAPDTAQTAAKPEASSPQAADTPKLPVPPQAAVPQAPGPAEPLKPTDTATSPATTETESDASAEPTSQTEATVPSQGPTAPHAPAPQQASAPLEPAACEPPKPQETPAPSPEAAAPPVEAQQEPPKNIEPPAEPTASAVPLDGQAAAGSGIASRIRQTDDEPRQEELPPTASGMEGIESRILDPTPVAGGMDHRSDADEPPAKEIPTAEEMPEAPRHGGPDVKPPVRQFQSGAFSVRIAGDAVEQEFDDGDDILLGAELTTDADADGGRYAVRIGPEEESPDWPDESSSPLNQLAMQEYATDAANGEAGCEEAVDVEVPGRVESVKVDEEIDEEVHRHESSDSDDPPATAKPQPAADDHGIAERIADLISQISRQRKGESAEDVAEERATEALREAPAQTADAPAEPAEPDRPTNTEQPAAAPADDGEAPRSQLDNLTHADDDDDDDEVVLEGVPAPPPPDEGENGQPIGAQDDARNRPSSEVVSIADIGEGRRRRIEAKTKKPSRRSRRSDTQRKRRSDGREVSVAEELLDNQMAGETPVDSDDGKRKGKRAKRRKHSSRSGTEPMSLARRAVMITPRPEAKQSRWRSLGIQAGIVVMALLATVLLLFLLVF